MVERDHRLDAVLEQLVDQPVVVRQPLGVGAALAAGLDPRPRDREAVAVGPELAHQRDVLGVAVVVVARLGARRPVDDRARLGGERVPDARALAVAAGRALDLVGRGTRPESEPRWEPGMPSGCESPTGTICHVAVEIRRGTHRFMERVQGRLTAHAFSFGSSYDADHVRFGPMVCHDDHLLRVGEGFPPHDHADLTIVTWVISGALAHDGSAGPARVDPARSRCCAPAAASSAARPRRRRRPGSSRSG